MLPQEVGECHVNFELLWILFAVAQIGTKFKDCGMRAMTAVNEGGFGFDIYIDLLGFSLNLEFQVYPRAPLYTQRGSLYIRLRL